MHAQRERFGRRACAAIAVCASVLAAAPAQPPEPPPDMAPPPPFDAPLEPPAERVDPATPPPADPAEPDVPIGSDMVPPLDAGPLVATPAVPIPPPPAAAPGFADGTASIVVPDPPRQPPRTSSAAAQRQPDAAADLPAARLLADALMPPPAAFELARGGAPAGRPVPLLEALERSGDRSRRLWITQAYWKLAAAAARHRFAADAEERLSLVAPGGNADDLAMLDAAIHGARGRAATAVVELISAQQELSDLVRLPVTEPPPLTADRPLTSAYQTHFETIFALRPATGRVRAIHRQLPAAHAAILARAQATAAAQERFDVVEALYAQAKKPINAVLSAHDAITAQQQAFVDAVAAYNLAIAEYVMAVADLSVPDEQFASMLIGQPIAWRAPQGAGIVPVSGQIPPGQFPAAQTPPGQVPSAAPPAGSSPRLFSSDPVSAPLPARTEPTDVPLPPAGLPGGGAPTLPPPPFPAGG